MDRLSTAAARNIFYGGSLFFFVIFTLLCVHTYRQARGVEKSFPITAEMERGKAVWERHVCFDCHTLFGEGARFAPELGKVWLKYGGADDAEGAEAALKGWFMAQPTGAEGRHQMPQLNLTDGQLHDLIQFLRYTSTVDTQNWPPRPVK